MSKSLIVEENTKCPKCKKTHKFCMWKTYYVTLFNRSSRFPNIFHMKCPHCKAKYLLTYPCLYHDSRKRYMVFFIPDTDQRQFNVEDMVPEYRTVKNYIFRLEADPNKAMERVRILNAGLNDKLFEIFRASVFAKVKKNQPQVKSILFHKETKSSFRFLVLEADGTAKSYLICDSSPFYKVLPSFEAHKSNQQKRYFERIDEEWVDCCPMKPIFYDI